MIRVLEVLATLQRAGAEQVAVSIACGLDRKRFQTGVVSLYDPFPNGFEPILEQHAIPVWHLSKKPGFDPRMYMRLQAFIKEFRPDVLHTHSYVLRYTLPFRVRAAVHTVHNRADREVEFFGQLIHRIAFRRGVWPVVVGEAVAASFRSTYKRDPAAIIPNGIETGRYGRTHGREVWRRANRFSSDEILIVSVARLEKQKDPQLLASAFGRAGVCARLLMVGGGSLACRMHGLERVQLLGPRTDIPEILGASDIFASSSRWEGYPIALLEAMASGLPVVATSVDGVPEIVGEAGILVPPSDEAALSAALQSLVGDAGLRHKLGLMARERAAQFDVMRMIKAYEALFNRAVEAP